MPHVLNPLQYLKHLSGRHAVILLTRRCNQACSYCNVVNREYPDSSLEEWQREIDLFDRYNIHHVTVMGGEPTEYADLPGFLSYLRAHLDGTFSLVTNGVRLRKDDALRVRLAEIGPDRLVVSINRLGQMGIVGELSENFAAVTVNTIVSRRNLDEVETMIREAARHRNVFFDPMVLQVDENEFSKAASEESLPDLHRLEALSRRLIRLKLAGFPLITSFRYLHSMPRYAAGWRWSCRDKAFSRIMALNSDRRIMICQGTAPLSKRLSELSSADLASFQREVDDAVEGCTGCLYNCTMNSSLHPVEKTLDMLPLAPRVVRRQIPRWLARVRGRFLTGRT